LADPATIASQYCRGMTDFLYLGCGQMNATVNRKKRPKMKSG
jgi:hypothetical protein